MKHIAVRGLSLIITLIAVSFAVFVFSSFAEGDSSAYILSEDAGEDEIVAYRDCSGLSENTARRYLSFLSSFSRGDWGENISGQSIKETIGRRFPVSAVLASMSVMFSLLIAIPLSFASLKRGSLSDRIVTGFASLCASFPVFVLSLLLIIIFSLKLGVFPSSGLSRGFVSFILPSFSLGIVYSSLLIRMFRRKIREALDSPSGFYSRAAGLGYMETAFAVAVKPALPLLVTVIGESCAAIIGGTAVIETVFALPGLGSLLVKAALERDALLSGTIVLISAFAVGIISICCDIVSYLLNPRRRQ